MRCSKKQTMSARSEPEHHARATLATRMVAGIPDDTEVDDVIAACSFIVAFALRDMSDDERARVLQVHTDFIKKILQGEKDDEQFRRH
jgi:hypothetical protein